ncbi:glycosyltransferase family 2 protein [Cupriavidus basilensis]
MLADLTALAGAALLLALVPGTLYLLLLTLAALLPARAPRKARQLAGTTPPHIAIVIPAHDEGAVISATLDALRQAVANDPLAHVVVVADNCTDDTAALARAHGVTVLERHDDALRGKGHALHHAFSALTGKPADGARVPDWFVVIDADSRLDPGFLPAMRHAIDAGADALQCRYLGTETAKPGARAALAQVAWFGWNLVRPRGRSRLGLSAGILGNGFALSLATLARVPYQAGSIVEDAEYHVRLLHAGLRVRWVEQATVRAEAPPDRCAAASQRARWTGGRLALLRTELGPTLRAALLGRWHLADAAADLLLPPLTLLVAAAAVLACWHTPAVALGARMVLAVVAMHVLAALWLGRAGRHHWLALLTLPAHLLWSFATLPLTLRAARSNAAWTRTARQPVHHPEIHHEQ